jgi:hypothetical protein
MIVTVTYVIYLLISLIVTIWVAHTLSTNGYLFLVDGFNGDEKLARSVNHLLVVGFYLINMGYVALVGGDGLLLDGNTLYVVLNRSAKIIPVVLSDDFSEGRAGEGVTDSSFKFPTTIAKAGDTFLVVISQINKREETPELPFTISRISVAE